MSYIYRIKTAEEFKGEGRLRPSGIPEGWASSGSMNHFMGQVFPEEDIKFNLLRTRFSIKDKGYSWAFDAEDLIIAPKKPKLSSGGKTLTNILDEMDKMDKMSIRPVVIDFSKPVKKPKKVAITEGKDAYGEKVYVGDMVIFSPSSSTIWRGVVQSFTPKSNPRVKIEGYDDYCMRPYIKVYVPVNGKRMIDMLSTLK